MSLPVWLARLFLITAGLLLGAGFWLAGYLPVAIALAVLPVLGLAFLWRGWGWSFSILLVLFTGSATAGFYLDVAPTWLVLGTLLALLAWDQEYFASRIKYAGRVESLSMLTKAHMARLTWVSIFGLFLVALTFLVQLEFTFGVAVLLAVLAVLGLSQGIAYLGRTG
jgi:hypothetical protein